MSRLTFSGTVKSHSSYETSKVNTIVGRRRIWLPIVGLWLVFSLYYLIRPIGAPDPFPAPDDSLLQTRALYNPELAAALDQGLRDFWQKPERVLDALGDLQGLVIADIGAGEGYFTLRLIDRVGETGHIYATDIQEDILTTLESRIPEYADSRVTTVLSSAHDIGIEGKVDLVLLIQVLGEVPNQREFLGQIREIMHDDSRLVVIDSKHITDPENGFTRPLNLNKLIRDMEAESFVFPDQYEMSRYAFLPKQYFLIFKKEPKAQQKMP